MYFLCKLFGYILKIYCSFKLHFGNYFLFFLILLILLWRFLLDSCLKFELLHFAFCPHNTLVLLPLSKAPEDCLFLHLTTVNILHTSDYIFY